MGASYRVRGVSLTQKQAAMLCALVKAPMSMDGIHGFDRRSIAALSDADLVDLNDKRAQITDEGRKVVIELSRKVNGTPSKAAVNTGAVAGTSVSRPATPREPETPATASTNAGITPSMIAATRAHIQACYENDLAALDRLAAIAAHQQAEGASL